MKKPFLIIIFLFLAVVFALPASASAAAKPGVKPGNFFYFFDTAIERVNLFFTFNPEKKAKRALEYADERLAEVEAIAEEKNPDAVKTAITNYESNIALATEKSKEVKDKGQAESLLTSITDNTSRNQEVLSAVLIKVPDEAREAITQAIEASRKGQEEAAKQIAELKGEIEQLKKEVAKLKKKEVGTGSNDQIAELEKLKKEVEELKKKPSSVPVFVAQKLTTPPITPNNNLSSPTPPLIEELKEKKNPIVSTPNPSVPPTISNTNNEQPKPQIQNSQPVVTETWEQQEVRDFAYADAKGWTSLISTNSLGEKRYYRREGNQWIRKNSEAEIQYSYVALRTPQNSASQPQEDPLLKIAKCQAEVKVQGGAVKQLLYKKAEDGFGKNIADAEEGIRKSKKKQLEIMMEVTPEDERILSPSQQNALRSASAAAIQSTIDYYVSMKQKNLRSLEKSKKTIDENIDQSYSELYIKCVNK